MMFFTALPLTSFATTHRGTCGDSLTWTFDDSTGLLTISGSGDMYDYSYEDINSLPWSIYADSITEIMIENGVTSIGDYAFFEMYWVTSVSISDSIEKIGVYAFYNCDSLSDIIIPDSVSVINSFAFSYCDGLVNATIGADTMYYGSFLNCYNLVNIVFTGSVKTIGVDAFCGCESLVEIRYTGTPEQIEKITICEGNGFNDPGGKCGDNLYWTFNDFTGTLTISGFGEMYNYDYERGLIANILYYKFPWYTDAPDRFTSGSFCRSYSKIKNIIIGEGVTWIQNDIFFQCENLEKIIVDKNNQNYSSDENGAFYNKDKTTLIRYPAHSANNNYIIPDSVNKIGNCAFDYCDNLNSISISKNIENIGLTYSNGRMYEWEELDINAFYGIKNISYIIVDADNKYYLSDAYGVLFNKDKTTLIKYPSGNTRKTYTIPISVTAIGAGAFNNRLIDVTFAGGEEQKNNVTVGSRNEFLNTEPHECDYNVFLYNQNTHPHCDVYRCSQCNNSTTKQSNQTFRDCVICYPKHVCDFIKLSYFQASHPHYAVYECSCSKTKTVTDEIDTIDSCKICNPPHICEFNIFSYVQENHPHYTVYKCSCGKEQGSNETNFFESCLECNPYDYTFSIQEPSRTTIRCKDGIVLHTNLDGHYPPGLRIEWVANNSKFRTTLTENNTFTITSEDDGYTTFTANLIDASGKVVATDTVEMRSKAGFGDKIGGFFRSLFGATKIYEN